MPVEEQSEGAAAQVLVSALRRLGLIGEAGARLTPLAGGVSSDIFKVETDRRIFVVKRALPKLRVAADWRAPIERSDYELAWLETVAEILPQAVPRVLGHDAEAGLFAMEYLAPEQFPVWKNELREGRVAPEFAAEVGRRLALIHAATADDPDLAQRFATDHIFHPIRLAPYLEAAAEKNPSVRPELSDLSRRTLACKRALVHGDVSPKNILCGPEGPVFLDAECAWYGDPAFDLAFCLNHLLLKTLWNRGAAAALLEAFSVLANTYLTGATWEERSDLEARAANLLAGLFLARVDGKSPVEYLTAATDRGLVRNAAIDWLSVPPAHLAAVRADWSRRLGA